MGCKMSSMVLSQDKKQLLFIVIKGALQKGFREQSPGKGAIEGSLEGITDLIPQKWFRIAAKSGIEGLKEWVLENGTKEDITRVTFLNGLLTALVEGRDAEAERIVNEQMRISKEKTKKIIENLKKQMVK